MYSNDDYSGKPVAVVFMCNHCPFVKHIADSLAERAREYREKGVAVLGINANDTASHPEDSPEHMRSFAEERGLEFPYLFDESQEVAKAFGATCTPDIFLFDSDHKLVYRGQFDDSRPSRTEPVTGADLSDAVDRAVAGQPPREEQKPSIGCNIKWKPGNEPQTMR
jgi:peroxiredoxin